MESCFCLPAAHPEQCSPQCFHFITVKGTITFSSKHCSQLQYLPPRKSNKMSSYFKHLTWRLLQSTSLWLFIWLRLFFLSNWEYRLLTVQTQRTFFFWHTFTLPPAPPLHVILNECTLTLLKHLWWWIMHHVITIGQFLLLTYLQLQNGLALKWNWKRIAGTATRKESMRREGSDWERYSATRRKQSKRKISSERKQKHIQWWHKCAHICSLEGGTTHTRLIPEKQQKYWSKNHKDITYQRARLLVITHYSYEKLVDAVETMSKQKIENQREGGSKSPWGTIMPRQGFLFTHAWQRHLVAQHPALLWASVTQPIVQTPPLNY